MLETLICWLTTVINFVMLLESFLGIDFVNVGDE